MEYYLTLAVLRFLLILALGTGFLGVVWFLSLFRTKGVPTISLFKKHKELLKQLHIEPNSRILDLGCGTGEALRSLATTHVFQQLDGVDLNKLALMYGRRRNKRTGYNNITLIYQDIFKTDITQYEYVYMFLMPNVMEQVEQWLEKTADPNTVFIVNSFKLPTRIPFDTIKDENGVEKIFLYKKQ